MRRPPSAKRHPSDVADSNDGGGDRATRYMALRYRICDGLGAVRSLEAPHGDSAQDPISKSALSWRGPDIRERFGPSHNVVDQFPDCLENRTA